MSGVSIGDVIAITEYIVKAYRKYEGAPKEILQVGKDAKDTGIMLDLLNKTIDQPNSLIHNKEDEMHVFHVYLSHHDYRF